MIVKYFLWYISTPYINLARLQRQENKGENDLDFPMGKNHSLPLVNLHHSSVVSSFIFLLVADFQKSVWSVPSRPYLQLSLDKSQSRKISISYLRSANMFIGQQKYCVWLLDSYLWLSM